MFYSNSQNDSNYNTKAANLFDKSKQNYNSFTVLLRDFPDQNSLIGIL